MRRAPALAANSLLLLAWATWFGGLLTLGAVSAPAIFRTARQWPGEPGPYLQFAGAAAGEGFRRFNYLAFACGTLLLLAGLAAWRFDRHAPRLHAGRLLLSVIALGITTWLTFALFPEMIGLRAAGGAAAMARFDQLHHLYEHASMLQAWLLLGVGVLTALIAAPRVQPARAFESGVGVEQPVQPASPAKSLANTPTPERLNA